MNSLIERAFDDFLTPRAETKEAQWWREGKCSITCLSGSGGAHGTVAALIQPHFREKAGFLLKLARESASVHLKQEARVLAAVRESVSPRLLPTLPEPLHVGVVAGHMYSVTSLLPGRCWRSILPVYGRFLRERIAVSAVEWLGQLARETMEEGNTGVGEDVLDVLGETSRTIQDRAVRDKVAGACDVLREAAPGIPRSVQHCDFWAGNIMVGRDCGICGVVDWEACLLKGYPGCDCMKLLRTSEMGEAAAARLLDRYCDCVGHPAVRPDTCRALGVWDIVRTRRIVEEQCSGRIRVDAERSTEAALRSLP